MSLARVFMAVRNCLAGIISPVYFLHHSAGSTYHMATRDLLSALVSCSGPLHVVNLCCFGTELQAPPTTWARTCILSTRLRGWVHGLMPYCFSRMIAAQRCRHHLPRGTTYHMAPPTTKPSYVSLARVFVAVCIA
jgi:hypothetical protein